MFFIKFGQKIEMYCLNKQNTIYNFAKKKRGRKFPAECLLFKAVRHMLQDLCSKTKKKLLLWWISIKNKRSMRIPQLETNEMHRWLCSSGSVRLLFMHPHCVVSSSRSLAELKSSVWHQLFIIAWWSGWSATHFIELHTLLSSPVLSLFLRIYLFICQHKMF